MYLNLNDVDVEILFLLQRNGRMSVQEISKKIHLSPSAVSTRIKNLEDEAYIKGYTAVLNKSKLNKNLSSLTCVKLKANSNANLVVFTDFIKQIPEVFDWHHVNGAFDFILYILVSDMQTYHQFLVKILGAHELVEDVVTFFILNESEGVNKMDLADLLKRSTKN